MNADDIKKLAKWSEAKEVQTKYGPRMLRKADVTEEFSAAWKTSKAEIKALGAGFSKSQSGEWELTWWEDLSADVKAHRQQSLEDSKAVAAEVDLPHPDGLDYFPFQKAGIKFGLARTHVLFGDEMGLGKTIQAIGILNADPSIKSALIICPKSLKLNWERELQRWLVRKLTVGVVNGGWPEADVVVINYDGLGKYRDRIMAREWGALIIDECHLIKNAKTQRSLNIKGCPAQGQKPAVEPIKAKRHIRLTGTPIVNRPVELYNLISDMGSWGSFFGFAKRYANAHHNGWGWDFSGAQNLDELQRRLRETIMVRRLKAEVLTELPRKIRQIVIVEPDTPEQKAAVSAENKYERDSEERRSRLQAEADALKDEGGEKYKLAVDRLNEAISVQFTEMARLSHDTAMAKVPAVIAHIETALEDNDNKIVVFAWHKDVIIDLKKGLEHDKEVSHRAGSGLREMDSAGGIDAWKSRDEDVAVQMSMRDGEGGFSNQLRRGEFDGMLEVSPSETRPVSHEEISSDGSGKIESKEKGNTIRSDAGNDGVPGGMPTSRNKAGVGTEREGASGGEYAIAGSDRSDEGIYARQRMGHQLESQRDQAQRHSRRIGNADLKSSEKIAILTGESTEIEREQAVNQFQSDPNCRIFIGNIQAAGVGITLTASSHVVFAELDWVPGVMSQAEDRCHRIGQTQTVLVQHVVLDESLDARKAKVLVAKQKVIDEALDKDHPAPVYPDRPEPKPEPPAPPKPPVMELPEATVKAVQAGLRLLAGMDPDYAREINDVGFNKIDGEFGHKLAALPTLTPRQAAAGLKLLKKYHRQLPAEIKKDLGIEEEPKKKGKKKLQPPLFDMVIMLVAGL